TQFAVRTYLAGHTGDFRGEGVELIDHRVERALQLENLALDVDGDLLRQVALGHRGRDLSDVSHLGRQVGGHDVHVVGQVLPRAGDPVDLGLATQLAVGAYLAGYTRHFRRERIQLIHHRVDGVLEIQHFAADVDRDLPRQ